MNPAALRSSILPVVLGALAFTAAGYAMSPQGLITDFTSAGPDLGWHVVNDDVMGGRSNGDFAVEGGELRFAGSTNTDGGGFSSIRSGTLALDLSAYAGIRLRVRGDGRRYTWRLATDARSYGRPVAYWADFDTAAGEWQTVDVPFTRFVPRFRGAQLSGPPLDASRIEGMGLMIYDRRDGPFELRLASVSGYVLAFSLDELRWQKRVLVLSAPREDDERLQQQRRAFDAELAEVLDRDMVLVTLVESGLSGVGEKELPAAAADAMRERLRLEPGAFAVTLIGKDGGVKFESGEPVPPGDIFALVDSMPMRQQEVKERQALQ